MRALVLARAALSPIPPVAAQAPPVADAGFDVPTQALLNLELA